MRLEFVVIIEIKGLKDSNLIFQCIFLSYLVRGGEEKSQWYSYVCFED